MKNNILFDLDGTLTDPKIGITTCIRYALKKLDHPEPENLDWCIGPPLLESFRQILVSRPPEQAQQAIVFYRERFADVGLFENEVYPEIPMVLEKLSATSSRLFVATSKPKIYADRIITHFGLRKYFTDVFGAELDGTRTDKGELIKYLLETVSVKSEQSIMVGDRKHDLIGASKNSVPGIGVLWGYGPKSELERETSIALVSKPSELLPLLIS